MMNRPLVDRIPFAKILIGLTILFGLSLGLCGLSFTLSWRGKLSPGMDQLMDRAAGTEILGMILSAVGVAVTCAVWAVMTIVTALLPKPAEPTDSKHRKDDPDNRY